MKIVLCCQLGMSSSLLIEKMKKAAKEIDIDLEVILCSINEAKNIDADVIMLAPQVHYAFDDLIQRKIPIGKINIRHYGLIDGEAVFYDALHLYEES